MKTLKKICIILFILIGLSVQAQEFKVDLGTEETLLHKKGNNGSTVTALKDIGKNVLVGDSIGLNILPSGATNLGNWHASLDNIANGNFKQGADNVALGRKALMSNVTQSDLVAIGSFALYNAGKDNPSLNSYPFQTSFNTAVGNQSMYELEIGGWNTALGYRAMKYGNEYYGNTAIGSASQTRTFGNGNTSLGHSSLETNAGPNNDYNTVVGHRAMEETGSNVSFNTIMGAGALQFNDAVQYNVAIGSNAMNRCTSIVSTVAIGDSVLAFVGMNGTLPEHGQYNTAVGSKSMLRNTIGYANTSMGFHSLNNNTEGINNVSVGTNALKTNTVGYANVAIGTNAMEFNVNGLENVAVGQAALRNNSDGINNVAVGEQALYDNTSGYNNVAIGHQALLDNVEGNGNVAVGIGTLNHNLSSNNTAVGSYSLEGNEGGYDNSALGAESLYNNNVGTHNTAGGAFSLWSNTEGNYNTSFGNRALYANSTGGENTGIGTFAGDDIIDNFGSTFLGYDADAAPNNFPNVFYSTAIGYGARVTADQQIRLGTASTGSIGGFQNWTNISDGRYKINIKENVPGIEFIKKLKPVTYNLNVDLINDELKTSAQQSSRGIAKSSQVLSGFVAQDVEKAANELGYSFSGVDKPTNENGMYGLRYAEFTVPIVKAIQEQQAQIDALIQENEKLKKLVETLLKNSENK